MFIEPAVMKDIIKIAKAEWKTCQRVYFALQCKVIKCYQLLYKIPVETKLRLLL